MARRNKTAWAALLLTAILFFFPARVLAAEKPDPGRNLSLSMTLKTPGENGRTISIISGHFQKRRKGKEENGYAGYQYHEGLYPVL